VGVKDQILHDYGLAHDTVLAQGTLRPDLIESGSHLASAKADTIKTHHNDTEEVRKLRKKGLVVEPLQQLYKDQVRVMGRRLGLPPEIVDRHPFPGPGLGVRILCLEKPYRLPDHDQLQAGLDSFVIENGYDEYSATLLPVRTVGVQGDGRSYKYLAGLQGPANWDRLGELTSIIPNNNHAINRVCYVFGEPIDRTNLGITPTYLTKESVDQIRHADAIVTRVLRAYDLMGDISQMPVVLFPANFGIAGSHSVGLRPFLTPDFMTGDAAKPGKDFPEVALIEMVDKILEDVPGISRVVLDLTSKPPGTTEWE
jgi:GMP synthase (glutamine-hydrolysing)